MGGPRVDVAERFQALKAFYETHGRLPRPRSKGPLGTAESQLGVWRYRCCASGTPGYNPEVATWVAEHRTSSSPMKSDQIFLAVQAFYSAHGRLPRDANHKHPSTSRTPESRAEMRLARSVAYLCHRRRPYAPLVRWLTQIRKQPKPPLCLDAVEKVLRDQFPGPEWRPVVLKLLRRLQADYTCA